MTDRGRQVIRIRPAADKATRTMISPLGHFPGSQVPGNIGRNSSRHSVRHAALAFYPWLSIQGIVFRDERSRVAPDGNDLLIRSAPLAIERKKKKRAWMTDLRGGALTLSAVGTPLHSRMGLFSCCMVCIDCQERPSEVRTGPDEEPYVRTYAHFDELDRIVYGTFRGLGVFRSTSN